MLRGAYEDQGEEVAEELKVPLDVKVAVWEADLAMLRRERRATTRRISDLADQLGDQLEGLSRERAARRPLARG